MGLARRSSGMRHDCRCTPDGTGPWTHPRADSHDPWPPRQCARRSRRRVRRPVRGVGAVPGRRSAASRPAAPCRQRRSQPPTGLDAATQKATELQQQMDDLKAESAAIAGAHQADDRAHLQPGGARGDSRAASGSAAQSQFDERVVGLYKRGHGSPRSRSSCPPARSARRSTAASSCCPCSSATSQALERATKLSAEAAYQAKVLDDLRSQDVALRYVAEHRLTTLQATRSPRSSEIVVEADRAAEGLPRREGALRRRAARPVEGQRPTTAASSTTRPAVVEPYTDRTYLVDQGEPVRYVTTGDRQHGAVLVVRQRRERHGDRVGPRRTTRTSSRAPRC